MTYNAISIQTKVLKNSELIKKLPKYFIKRKKRDNEYEKLCRADEYIRNEYNTFALAQGGEGFQNSIGDKNINRRYKKYGL